MTKKKMNWSGQVRWAGCILFLLPAYLMFIVLATTTLIYLLNPFGTEIILIGIDYTEPTNHTARSDTLMYAQLNPSRTSINLLSIPRDLWVFIPGVGENRINTAHFFAEANAPGSGPEAVRQTIQHNFNLTPEYFIRIRFESFREIVDSMGGITIHLDKPMAGYDVGTYHLTGNKALAFARHRKGSDDFFRMEQGQFLLKAALAELKRPTNWSKLPAFTSTLLKAVETDIPIWLYPRILVTILLSGNDGIQTFTITRDMVTPQTTSGGAQVLIPIWERINPFIDEIFRE